MKSLETFLAGASIGLAVAAPIGPMAVLIIHRTLARGVLAGLATGAGASTIHLLYAALAIAGVNQLAAFEATYRVWLHVAAAASLVVMAALILRRGSGHGAREARSGQSLLNNYASAVAFNSVNPVGFILLLGAVVAVTGVTSVGAPAVWALAVGVFLGSIGWWLALVGVTATVGIRISPAAAKLVDAAAALVIAGLAVSLLLRA